MPESLTDYPGLFHDGDETIQKALSEAHVPALMMAMVHMTGDTSILRGNIRPSANLFGDGEGDLSASDKDSVRLQALKVLAQFRDSGGAMPPPPGAETLQEMVNFMLGEDVPEKYVALLQEELGVSGVDSRDVHIALPDGATEGDFRVLIVGAGMSGLLAAIRLKNAGIPFVIIEKNEAIGGTWFANTYPGCRVDNPNHLYSYSFEPNHDWPLHFSTHDVLFDYFNRCADKYGIREHIRFNTEVVQATYNEEAANWSVEVRDEGGTTETLEAQAFISAVGQLNRPKMPDIPGIERFEGASFHSAEWDHGVDLKGKRVAVVGTGASAAQFIPEIAPEAGDLTIFQRTPPWISETPHYHDAVSDNIKWLLHHVPYYDKWYRFWLFWMTSEGLLPMVKVDPNWTSDDGSVSESHAMIQNMTKDYIARQVGDDPDLLEKVVPNYPMGGKRNLRDNGAWLKALKRDNVTVTTDTIAEITATGVRTEDGTEYPVDVIVYGTGFTASEFLAPMKIIGKEGVDLRESWGDNPRAYLGITVPGFPNLFCLYGPNTNIVVNGSIIFFAECEVRYVLACVKLLVEEGLASMECRQDIHDSFNEDIDAANAQMAWGLPGFSSWYKNSEGRVTQNWPHSLLDYWAVTREPAPADFEFT
jgi:4-hydroxyacetophenone monooxygenase